MFFYLKYTYSILLVSLKPTKNSLCKRDTSMVIVSSGGGSIATSLSGYLHIPPEDASICKKASFLLNNRMKLFQFQTFLYQPSHENLHERL